MLVAFCDQLFGNSTSRCSKAGFAGSPITRVADLPLELVERVDAGFGEAPLDRQALIGRVDAVSGLDLLASRAHLILFFLSLFTDSEPDQRAICPTLGVTP